jgi:O-antigen/teichoic acid export membrane protein
MTSATASAAIRPRLGKKVLKGSTWSLFGQGGVLLASAIATPFTIRFLGTERYGALALLNVIVGYFAFADLGMGTASTRFGSAAFGRDDEAEEAKVIWTSLAVAIGPLLLIYIAWVALAGSIPTRLFTISNSLAPEFSTAVRWSATVFLVRAVSGVLNTPQLVRLRFDSYTIINSGCLVLQILLTPVVIFRGGGLLQVIQLIVVCSFVALCAHVVLGVRLLPALKKPVFGRELAWPLILFGGGVVLAYLAEIMLSQGDKALVATYLSVRQLAYYSVATMMAALMVPVPLALGQAILPAFSRLETGSESLSFLFGRAWRLALMCGLPSAVGLAVVAEPVLRHWIGAEFAANATHVCYVLIGGQVLSTTGYIPSSFLMSRGRSRLIAALRWAELPGFVIVAYLLIQKWGPIGCAFAWAIRCGCDLLLLSLAAERTLHSADLPNARHSWTGWMAAIACLAAPLMALASGRGSAVQLGALVLGISLYAVCCWRWILSADDRKWVLALRSGGN